MIISGAEDSDGSGTIVVAGDLIKESATAFEFSHHIGVQGNYNNTAGNLTFTDSPTNYVNGTATLTTGTVSGTVDLNSTVTINGGGFNGTVMLTGGAQQTINGTAPSFAGLTVNNSNGIVLSTATGVSGALTLTSGNITTTSSNLLTLGSSASPTGYSASSFIDGPLAHTGTGTKNFPIGKGTEYRLVVLTNITTSDAAPVIELEMFTPGPSGSADGTTLNNISAIWWRCCVRPVCRRWVLAMAGRTHLGRWARGRPRCFSAWCTDIVGVRLTLVRVSHSVPVALR